MPKLFLVKRTSIEINRRFLDLTGHAFMDGEALKRVGLIGVTTAPALARTTETYT